MVQKHTSLYATSILILGFAQWKQKRDFSVIAQIFCGKLHIVCYNVELHRVGGLPNSGVDNLLLLLECFAGSLA